jgi:hypothetical protein
VDEAMTGGKIEGDVYQTAHNVIFGLYRYGEDMVVSQGIDAAGVILDMNKLMDDIAEYWGFEQDVVDDLTNRLVAEVRDMLDKTVLPGQPVNLINTGYTVSQAVLFDNDRGFALAHSPTAPDKFVTWQFTNDNGNIDFYWGRYVGTEERAKVDFINRAADYKEANRVTEKPLPFAAVELDAEHNYNMVDGVINNMPANKPDLTDGQTYAEIRELAPETLHDKSDPGGNGNKASVLDQIRAAQKNPKPSREPGAEREKIKTEPDL